MAFNFCDCGRVFFAISRSKGLDAFEDSSTQWLHPNYVWKGWNSADVPQWTFGELQFQWQRLIKSVVRQDYPQVLTIWWVHECGMMEAVKIVAVSFSD